MKFITLVAALFLITVACSVEERAGVDEKSSPRPATDWKIVDPGGAGAMFLPTISPHDPEHAFVRCDMTGAYVTTDGGRSWRMFNLRTLVQDFEFDPNDPNTVYASNTGLYRSENRGKTWRLIYPDPKNIVAERMVGDHAEQHFETTGGVTDMDGTIEKVRVDPADSRHIFISLRPRSGSGKVRILSSKDRGGAWKVLAEVPGTRVRALFPGAWKGQPGQVTVFTDRAAARVSETTGRVLPLKLPVESIRAAGGGRGEDGCILYILADVSLEGGKVTGGVYRSTDWGKNWVQVNKGLLGDDPPRTAEQARFITLAACEGAPRVLYLSCSTYMADDGGKMVRHFGTLKSENSGSDWRWVYRADNDVIFTDNYAGYWKDWSYGPGWSESPWDIGVCPTDPDECMFTDVRTVRSRDGGATWQQVCSDIHPDSSCSSRNIGGNTTYGVHFDPFDKKHIFITYTDMGLFHSYNGGESWFHAIKGIPRHWRNTCYWLEFDPEVKDRIFSIWAECHDIPRLKVFRPGRKLEREEFQGGAAVSNDGGRSWSVSNAGMPPNTVCTHILLDPESPAQARTLYVCAVARGVYKSTDSGASWQAANNGLPADCNAWRMVRLPSGRLFLLICRGLKNGAVADGALYSSDDRAESWQKAVLPDGVTGPNDLVFDPSDPERMYLSCWPWAKDGREHCGGLLRTEDCGKSWEQVFNEQAHVYAAAVDPENTSTIFINTFDSAAFRSDDRGNNWYRLEGYNFKWGHRPVVDPHNPGMLYLTAFGGNTYHGPAGGVPGAVEDIEDGDSFLLRW
ncbi:MAG: hypothetical protein U9P14_12710 [Gemmatimonadota bacterium]|nr:hypothetical protein [Gemmatimonadota bacterium]